MLFTACGTGGEEAVSSKPTGESISSEAAGSSQSSEPQPEVSLSATKQQAQFSDVLIHYSEDINYQDSIDSDYQPVLHFINKDKENYDHNLTDTETKAFWKISKLFQAMDEVENLYQDNK